MKAMVLAAGLGARLRPITDQRPKALVEVSGRTLLEITLSRLRAFGIREVIVNVHHFADMILEYLQTNDNFGMRIAFSREEVLLDTGGGVKKAAYFFLEDSNSLQEPFILHNVDVISTIDLHRMLWGHGYSASSLHGDQEQEVRFKVLDAFRQRQVKCLVCTDVAARGLDIERVSCVVNYEIPEDEDSYLHRIGRTGRAQETGVAISIVAPQERANWQKIQRWMDGKVERLARPRAEGRGRDADEKSGERPRGGRGRGASRRRGEGRDRAAGGTRNPRAASSRAPGEHEERPAGERPSRRRSGGRKTPHAETSVASKDGVENGQKGPETSPDATGDAGADDVTRSESTYTSRRLAEKSAAKKKLVRLEDIDDDFVKTDYFDIDESVIQRAGPPTVSKDAKAGTAESPSNRRGGGRSHGSRAGGGKSPRRGGRGRRPRTSEGNDRAADEKRPAEGGGRSAREAEREGSGEGEKRTRPPRRRRRNKASKEK